jgi:tetratricopeptide (TPR) repeat protein
VIPQPVRSVRLQADRVRPAKAGHYVLISTALVGLCLLAAACGPREGATNEPAALAGIALPELSRVDAPVQAQIRERYAAVTKMLASTAPAARDLGTAFGEYGMLLHATEYYDAAEPAYRNAEALVPDDPRWPYYLAHLHRTEGETDKAMAAYRRALALRPDDVPTLVWLGRMHLDQGEPDRAEPLFARAQSLGPDVVAVQVGLGQAALARKDFARAAQHLEAALASDPRAASVYSPLAMAYRGLGQIEKAETLASQWRNVDIAVPDPLRTELDIVVQSGLSYELRGVRALDSGDFTTAATLFRQGLDLAPPGSLLSRSLRHKLGTALALNGDVPGAIKEFEQTVRLAPAAGLDEPAAKASYSLGVLLASNGQPAEAIDRLTAAVRYNPNYLEAQMALGDVLRGSGRIEASLAHYAAAIRINPRAAEARFNYAMALVKLRRYGDARAWLEESVRAQGDRPELANALARLLASAPDARVRDGQRALAMTRQLAATNGNTEVGESMAMALAEVGAYRDAVAVQRDVIEAARQGGAADDLRRMTANLQLYESGRPCRTPWPDDHPVHTAGLR